MRIFYTTGPGNVIQAHKNWENGAEHPEEFSVTYSGQFADLCRQMGAEAHLVSWIKENDIYRSGSFVVEHRQKPFADATGMVYHLSQILYRIGLLATAIRYRADVAVVSFETHNFLMFLFNLAGIPVVTVLHNSLWPNGLPPKRSISRMILRLDALFYRWGSKAVIGASPQCLREVEQLTGGKAPPRYVFMPLYRREMFAQIPPPRHPNENPFRIMFAGRITRDKGVFDLLDIAAALEKQIPGRVQWVVCGSGHHLDELKRQQQIRGLDKVIDFHGWTKPTDMLRILSGCHASIVPSKIVEGLAQTVVESILAGRPVVTSRVVPALELLRPACVEAQPNDIDSYVAAVLRLLQDEEYYRQLCEACGPLQAQFYDPEQGIAGALRKAIFN